VLISPTFFQLGSFQATVVPNLASIVPSRVPSKILLFTSNIIAHQVILVSHRHAIHDELLVWVLFRVSGIFEWFHCYQKIRNFDPFCKWIQRTEYIGKIFSLCLLYPIKLLLHSILKWCRIFSLSTAEIA